VRTYGSMSGSSGREVRFHGSAADGTSARDALFRIRYSTSLRLNLWVPWAASLPLSRQWRTSRHWHWHPTAKDRCHDVDVIAWAANSTLSAQNWHKAGSIALYRPWGMSAAIVDTDHREGYIVVFVRFVVHHTFGLTNRCQPRSLLRYAAPRPTPEALLPGS